MMRKQYKNRIKMHKELQQQLNALSESRLAIDLLKKPDGFESVKKISAAIIKIIAANREKVAKIIAEDFVAAESKLINELREPYFGCLYNKDQTVTPSGAVARMVAVLSDKNSSLDKIMQLHSIFCYRIYPKLSAKNDDALAATLRPDSLFCGGLKTETKAKPTSFLGIVKHPFIAKQLGEHPNLHIRAVDKYKLNQSSCFFGNALEQSIPVVCGPSGHTSTLLLGAKLYGDLSSNELEEYVLACFAFLAAGGNHSFHEVMSVAKLIDIDFPLPEQVANKL